MDLTKAKSAWKVMREHSFVVDSESMCDNLECVICKKLMIDACHSTCGCQYCYECVALYLKEGDKYCPGGNAECNEEYLVLERDVTRNKKLNNRILKLKVKCPNEFCQSLLEVADMEEHLRICSKEIIKCPFMNIGCDDAEGPKDEVLNHLREDTLLHSQLLIESIDNLRNEINEFKGKSDMLSLKEEYTKQMKALETNLGKSNLEIFCVKENFTKEVSVLKKNWETTKMEVTSLKAEYRMEINALKETRQLEIFNLKEESRKEINILKLGISSLKEESEMNKKEILKILNLVEVATKGLKDLRNESNNKGKRINVLEQQLKELRNNTLSRFTTITKEMNKNKVTVEKNNKKNDEITKGFEIVKTNTKKDNDKVLMKVGDLMNELKESKEEKDKTAVNDLEVDKYEVKVVEEFCIAGSYDKVDESINCVTNVNVDFIWKICDLSKKVETMFLNDILSQAFYSKGYKLCLRLWINGDNIGLYCVIMKGDNDDKVSWPLTHAIKLSIHDQLTFGIYKSVTIQYSLSRDKRPFERPEDAMNYRVGGPWPFINYSVIKRHSSVIVNDSIVVSCCLEVP